VPYQVVIGRREVEEGSVSVRLRDGQRLDGLAVEEFLARVQERVERRGVALWE
jgi:threonyl-tRNA synthetase